MRVVVDTNVWISAALRPAGPPGRVRAALVAGQFTLVASEPLLEELAGVLARPRLVRRYGLSPEEVAEAVAVVRQRVQFVPIAGTLHVCRDPKDDMFVETALAGAADVLVSRDDDLKRAPEVAAVLGERGVRVLTVQQFLDALAKAPASGEASAGPA